ncbi:MAG: HupE/UreJ family protein [Pseudohongiellaceae bacterium]|nr:HupE/UreJ family protein [Pseudohongiellaceae bacterium]
MKKQKNSSGSWTRRWARRANDCSILLVRNTLAFIGLLLVALPSSQVSADDIPLSVAVQAFVAPEGDTLSVLMRVPMDALGEIDFPKEGVPGSLIFSEADPTLRTAVSAYILSNFHLFEEGELLQDYEVARVRVSLPSNRSFVDYQQALANIEQPRLDDSVNMYWRQGLLDVLIRYPIRSENSRFAVDPRLGGLGVETNTVIRYILPSGAERPFTFIGNPGQVSLDPSWFQAAWRFIVLGFDHILEGKDHLLFLFCLLIPLRNIRALVPVVTAFTVAHSITLMSSLFGVVPSVLWFPPLIETLIALSIVYMAFENIIGFSQEHRWLVTFGFGLVHGFGFSFLLTESMQFAGTHLVTSLLAFNIGVEIGQLLVIIIAVPALALVFKHFVAEKIGVIIMSAIVAHSAWHWMAERWETLMAYDIAFPELNRAFYSGLVGWAVLIMVALAALWVMETVFGRYFSSSNVASESH